jgi:hypothetical protein
MRTIWQCGAFRGRVQTAATAKCSPRLRLRTDGLRQVPPPYELLLGGLRPGGLLAEQADDRLSANKSQMHCAYWTKGAGDR